MARSKSNQSWTQWVNLCKLFYILKYKKRLVRLMCSTHFGKKNLFFMRQDFKGCFAIIEEIGLKSSTCLAGKRIIKLLQSVFTSRLTYFFQKMRINKEPYNIKNQFVFLVTVRLSKLNFCLKNHGLVKIKHSIFGQIFPSCVALTDTFK